MAAKRRARLGPTVEGAEDADPRVMCERLLRETRVFYGSIDAAEEGKSSAKTQLSQTIVSDVNGCAEELSLKAISCVSESLRERRAEFPWLVDQCARAFPKAGTRSADAEADE